MLRLCYVLTCRNFLQPRTLLAQANAGVKSIEEKLGFPPRPKKPVTPYIRYLLKIRPSLLKKHPQATVTDIAKLSAEHWNKADAAVKEQLEDEYKSEMMTYVKVLTQYEMSLSEEQKDEIKRAKVELKDSKNKKKVQKELKDMGKPPRPASPFLLFFLDQQSTRGDQVFREFQTRVAQDWKNLDEKSKAKYTDMHKKSKETYKRELSNWEEKMVRLGHIDLIRSDVLTEIKNPRRRQPGKKE